MAGVVESCAAEDNEALSVIVKVFQWVGEVTEHSQGFSDTKEYDRWPAEGVKMGRCWYYREMGSYVVVVF